MNNSTQFNSVSYVRTIALSRPIDKLSIDVPELSVSEVIITNDLTTPILSISVLVEESESRKIEGCISDGHSFLIHTLETEVNDRQVLQIDKFVIDSIELVDVSSDSTIYLIKARSFVYPVLNAPVYYSNYGSPTSSLNIIKNMFRVAGIPFEEQGKVIHDDNIEYITSVKNTLMDSIKELEKTTLSSNDITFIHYDHIMDRYTNLSLRDKYINGQLFKFNRLMIPTAEASSDLPNTIFDYASYNYFTGGDLLNSAIATNVMTYDHISRNWSTEVVDYNKLNDVLSTPLKRSDLLSEENILKGLPPQYVPYITDSKEVIGVKSQIIGTNLKDICRLSDILVFTVVGNMERDVGQLVQVLYGGDNPTYATYSGGWVISKIENIYTSGDFKQNIALIRTKKVRNING